VSAFLSVLLSVAKAFAPGTPPFFVAAACLCLLLMRWRGMPRRIAATLGGALIAGYLLMSLPWTAARVSAKLRGYSRLNDARAAEGAEGLTVLEGDSQHAREIETVRLYSMLQPKWVIVSGSPEMRDELVGAGIPVDRLIMEPTGRTTRTQLLGVARIVAARHLGKFVLIVSVIHMPRALATARDLGLDVVPSASDTRRIDGRPQWWPAYDALRLSRDSIYEYVAWWYYRWRGWIANPIDSRPAKLSSDSPR
jgi:uncharacterized SAM-binding protein YcdF (DUF218 family)